MEAMSAVKEHETRVWYWLSGGFEPGDITLRASVSPTKTARADDLVTPKSTHRHKELSWRVEPPLSRSASVEAHLDALLALLAPGRSELAALGREFQAGVTIVIYSYDAQGPEVVVRPDVAQWLHEMNTTLIFDLYNLVPDGPAQGRLEPGSTRNADDSTSPEPS